MIQLMKYGGKHVLAMYRNLYWKNFQMIQIRLL